MYRLNIVIFLPTYFAGDGTQSHVQVVTLDGNLSLDAWLFTKSLENYGNNLDKVHLSECGSEAASYKLKGLALKHSEKPRYRPKASFNGLEQSGLNEREEGYA
ncbi:hypothetical protein Tco_0083938 [Tanacetum coccineum]